MSFLKRRLEERLKDPEFRKEWEVSEKSFPTKTLSINGKEYIAMESDIFRSFFLEMMKYSDINYEIIQEIDKKYTQARKIKKKRIRLKKEKQALLAMYDLIDEHFI